MRVAFITMQFPVPSETFASNDIRVLTGLGVQVSVHGLRFAHPRHGALLRERSLSGVEVTHNSAGGTLRGLLAALSRPQLFMACLAWLVGCSWRKPAHLAGALLLMPRAFEVLAELERKRPDVVHVYWGHYPSLVGFLAQRRIPEAVSSLSLAAYDLTFEFGGTIDVARRADFVRTLAEFNVPAVARFTGVPEERIEVIHDGIDVDRIERIAARQMREPRRIAIASRLIPEKRVDSALEIFARVHRRWPDATFAIMGDGPERGRLERLARDFGVAGCVEFLGHVEHERVLAEFGRSGAVLFTSTKVSERLPNAVKEGMACGCVCIVSDTPGIHELVRHGDTGYVWGAESGMTADALLEDLFAGRMDAEAMGARAREEMRERFNLRRTVRRYRDRWRQSLDERAGKAASESRRTGSGARALGAEGGR